VPPGAARTPHPPRYATDARDWTLQFGVIYSLPTILCMLWLSAHLCLRISLLTVTSYLPLSETTFTWGIRIPSNTWLLWPTWVHDPNGISISSAIFAGLTTVTDRRTYRPHYSVCKNRPRVCSTAVHWTRTQIHVYIHDRYVYIPVAAWKPGRRQISDRTDRTQSRRDRSRALAVEMDHTRTLLMANSLHHPAAKTVIIRVRTIMPSYYRIGQ